MEKAYVWDSYFKLLDILKFIPNSGTIISGRLDVQDPASYEKAISHC
jgi:hypothetical protein